MDKPQIHLGQRWKWLKYADRYERRFLISGICSYRDGKPYSYYIDYEDGTNAGSFSASCIRGNADAVEFDRSHVTTTNTTGQQAADWLRKVADVLVEKSASYGDSIGNPLRIFSHVGVTEGVRVRIDDKLSRVARGKEWPGDDVIVDLVGYLALLAVTEKIK